MKLAGPSLLVLVGPAGAGKSTWAAENFEPGQIVSSDRLRGQLGRGEWDQDVSSEAFDLLEQIVVGRLGRGLTTVIDTLGYDQSARQRWAALARNAGMEALAVVFETSAESCRDRNRQRSDPVPARVLSQQIKRRAGAVAELPDDGFDRIETAAAVHAPAAPFRASEPAVERQRAAPAGLRFGLQISRFPWETAEIGEQLAATARIAEEAGFSSLWVMDHFRQIPQVGRAWEPMMESFTTLPYLAAATREIELGVLVAGVLYRNIAHLAKIVATLDVLSSGRARCGIGAGWFEAEAVGYGWKFPSTRSRLDGLEDALRLLPLMWGPGTPEFTGKTVHVPEAICYPRPLQDRIPILVGGSGEQRTLRLVAELADACNFFGGPDDVAAKLTVLRRHCEDVGRDPTDITVTHFGPALVADDPASLRSSIERLRPPGQAPEAYAASANAGTVEDHIGRFRRLAEAGVEEVIVGPADLAEDAIRGFAPVIGSFVG